MCTLGPNSCSKAVKPRVFTSVFEMPSPGLKNKHHSYGKIVEQQYNEISKIPEKTGNIKSTESRNSFKHLDESISKDNSIKLAPGKHEISLKATMSSRHSEFVMETNDDASFDVSFGKGTDKKTDQVK